MALHIYLKELVNNPVLDRNGRKIPFEVLGGDFGGLTVDDASNPQLVEDLDKMVKKRAGGVMVSTEAELAEKKSLPVYKPSVSLSDPLTVFQPQRPTPLNPRPNPNEPAAVAEFVPSTVPTPTIHPLAAMDLLKGATPPPAASQEPPKVAVEVKPRTGRIGKPPAKTAAPAAAA